jgi:hypothetical protein
MSTTQKTTKLYQSEQQKCEMSGYAYQELLNNNISRPYLGGWKDSPTCRHNFDPVTYI